MAISNYLVRRMTESDVDEVMAIEQQSFTLPWSKQSYMGELKNQFATYLVCDREAQLVGYVGLWVVFEEAHITNVAVDPKWRGQGLGRVLMEEAEKIARQKKALRILLEVRPSNYVALALYESMGYMETGRRPAYYTDNCEDAIIMTKLLF
ncbi:MAG: ribosomal protein S18-alanine N-acetyltransferase [Syntrophomonadaceae bacterium]